MRLITAAVMLVVGSGAYGASKVVNDSVQSELFGRPMHVRVYLPDGFDSKQTEKYPVLYLLHGRHGDETDWSQLGHMQERADQLIRAGEIPPMVVVMPDAGYSRTGGNDGYFDLPDYPYESYFFGELLPTLEKRYNAGGVKEKRALAGLSMGGGGSVGYAEKHPEMFRAVYAMSAAVSLPEGRKGKEAPYEDAIRQNDCIEFVVNATPQTLTALRDIRWTLDCGDDDFLFDPNIDFYRAMRKADVPTELRIRDGIHSWTYWRDALPDALRSSFR